MNSHLSIFRLINFYISESLGSEFGIPNWYTDFYDTDSSGYGIEDFQLT